MPEKSVGFAIGNLRARENRLLKKNDLSGFAAASNVTELARMLRDKGIGKTDNADVPALLHEDAEEMWKYLTDNAPDTAAFAPFSSAAALFSRSLNGRCAAFTALFSAAGAPAKAAAFKQIKPSIINNIKNFLTLIPPMNKIFCCNFIQ